jgi:hypothetical protein
MTKQFVDNIAHPKFSCLVLYFFEHLFRPLIGQDSGDVIQMKVPHGSEILDVAAGNFVTNYRHLMSGYFL